MKQWPPQTSLYGFTTKPVAPTDGFTRGTPVVYQVVGTKRQRTYDNRLTRLVRHAQLMLNVTLL